MATLGALAATIAVLCAVKAGDAATATGVNGGAGSAARTVVATAEVNAPHAAPQAVTITVAPGARPEVPVRIQSTAPPVARPHLDLRQIVYTVAGNQRPDDPVTVVYADQTGALRTIENVTLPWTMTVIPDLPVNYVYATSRGSQLNCWITDASGATAVSQTDYGTTTSCNRR